MSDIDYKRALDQARSDYSGKLTRLKALEAESVEAEKQIQRLRALVVSLCDLLGEPTGIGNRNGLCLSERHNEHLRGPR